MRGASSQCIVAVHRRSLSKQCIVVVPYFNHSSQWFIAVSIGKVYVKSQLTVWNANFRFVRDGVDRVETVVGDRWRSSHSSNGTCQSLSTRIELEASLTSGIQTRSTKQDLERSRETKRDLERPSETKGDLSNEECQASSAKRWLADRANGI